MNESKSFLIKCDLLFVLGGFTCHLINVYSYGDVTITVRAANFDLYSTHAEGKVIKPQPQQTNVVSISLSTVTVTTSSEMTIY